MANCVTSVSCVFVHCKNFRTPSFPQLVNRHLWRIISKPNHLRVEKIELVVAKTPSPVILTTYDSGDVHSAFGFVVG